MVLEDGVPHARTLGAGGDAHVFVLYVPPGGLADVKITLTALSGAPRLAAAVVGAVPVADEKVDRCAR